MKEIRSEIEIGAPATKVWEVLVDFQRYKEWNPFIYGVSGEAIVGQKIRINLRTPSGKERNYEPTITRAILGRELRWIGKGFFLNGEHIFTLEDTKPEFTLFVQSEIFTGPLSLFFGEGTEKDITSGIEQMNLALKRRAESAHE